MSTRPSATQPAVRLHTMCVSCRVSRVWWCVLVRAVLLCDCIARSSLSVLRCVNPAEMTYHGAAQSGTSGTRSRIIMLRVRPNGDLLSLNMATNEPYVGDSITMEAHDMACDDRYFYCALRVMCASVG